MFNMKSLFHRALCALMLTVAAGGAFAGPTYHVTVNTASLAADISGNLDFALGNFGDAPEAIVTLSNFSGAFGSETDRFGNVGGAIPAAVTLVNSSGMQYLTQAITLGGMLGFDVNFSGDFETTASLIDSNFNVSLFNDTMDAYLAENFISFALVPVTGGNPSNVIVNFDRSLADVGIAAEVPEPSELLLMLTGLAMMGALVRRRSQR